jgi:hypothetical protein
MALPPESPSADGTRVAARGLDLRAAADVAAVLLVVLLGVLSIRNALVYPPIGGYDAAEHIAYARSLIEQGELPHKSGAYYTPPLWYVMAGSGIELGDALGLDEPERIGQLVNALLTTGAGVLVLALARVLFPGRPLVALGSVAFFVACPITLRMASMFHPQALVLFLSTAGLLVVTRMLARRSYGVLHAALAGVLLGAAELVRSVAIWSVGVAAIALLAGVLVERSGRRRAAAALAIVLALGVAVPLPWYVYLQQTYGHAIFGRPPTTAVEPSPAAPPPAPSTPAVPAPEPAPAPVQAPVPRRPSGFFFRIGLPEVLTKPHRNELDRAFWPTLYADVWGDAFGAWSWGPTRADMSVGVEDRLSLQSFAGVPLTFVAGAGWLAFIVLALRRLRTTAELLVPIGMPAAALTGLVYYGIRSYEPDLDFIKGMFALTAVPFWALSFGFAVDALWHRLPRAAGVAVGVVLAAALLVCLEFGIA